MLALKLLFKTCNYIEYSRVIANYKNFISVTIIHICLIKGNGVSQKV